MKDETKQEYMELTADMPDDAAGGSIYYKADGSSFDAGGAKKKYKVQGITNNGNWGKYGKQ